MRPLFKGGHNSRAASIGNLTVCTYRLAISMMLFLGVGVCNSFFWLIFHKAPLQGTFQMVWGHHNFCSPFGESLLSLIIESYGKYILDRYTFDFYLRFDLLINSYETCFIIRKSGTL